MLRLKVSRFWYIIITTVVSNWCTLFLQSYVKWYWTTLPSLSLGKSKTRAILLCYTKTTRNALFCECNYRQFLAYRQESRKQWIVMIMMKYFLIVYHIMHQDQTSPTTISLYILAETSWNFRCCLRLFH